MIETTDFRKSEQYTLSIRCTADGFCFSLYNPLKNSEEAYSNYFVEADMLLSECGNLKKIVRQTEWLNNSFGKVNVLLENTRQMTIPLDLFEDEQAEALFYHSFHKVDNEIVNYNVVPNNNIVVLYGMDQSTKAFLLEIFPNAKFYSKTTALLNHYGKKRSEGNRKQLIVHVDKHICTLMAYEDGHLLLCNAQVFTQQTDVAFHSLACWKSLNMNQEEDELRLSGEVGNLEELLHILQKYLQHIIIEENTTDIDIKTVTQ
ncbi:MAG: DUF3822 family protein [Bacteroidaceae bacterium]|nr:DUF3822 family protein [Bacteroidaceae bacterium]